MSELKNLKMGVVVPGTTWLPDNDGWGTSFRCTICGHYEFYHNTIPEPCPHNPEEFEKGMQEKRSANRN